MILSIILILLNLTVSEARGFDQILSNNPNLPIEYITQVDYLAEKYCKKNNIPCNIFKAILAVESRYELSAYNKKTKDYGIGQINEKTIEAMSLDKVKLMTDLDYSIRKSAKILAYFHKRFAHKEQYWYVRYNVGTAKNAINYKAAKQYKKKVQSKL